MYIFATSFDSNKFYLPDALQVVEFMTCCFGNLFGYLTYKSRSCYSVDYSSMAFCVPAA